MATKPLVILQHEPGNPPGAIAAALERLSVPFEVRRLDLGDPVPSWPDEASGIISIGGAMAYAAIRKLPYFEAEKELLRTAVHQGGPVWGICLGAQLLTLARGGEIWRCQWAPVGWVQVMKVLDDPLLHRISSPFPVFSWRKFACSMPLTAHCVARSDDTPWVFRAGGRAWGIQFHPEITEELAVDWRADIAGGARRGAGELEEQLRRDTERFLPAHAEFCRQLTENFVRASGLLPKK